MSKFCLYSDSWMSAPCFSISMFKYSYLKDFVQDIRQRGGEKRHNIAVDINCIAPKEAKGFDINNTHCINCMFCLFGCVGNRVCINNQLQPKEFCHEYNSMELNALHEEIVSKIFRGNFINILQVEFSHLQVKYKSFDDFTKVNETKNISVWTANAMKFLSSSLEPRVALEVGLQIQERNRGGRLDVSLYNIRDKYIFVAETKVGFREMMSDMRFESQLIAYETELQTCKEYDSRLKLCKFLVIGGHESELLPYSSPFCTSDNNRSRQFYDILRNRHFFFFSANALLAFGLMKIFVSEKFCLENIYKIITNPNYVGMLSSGLVTDKLQIVPFNHNLFS